MAFSMVPILQILSSSVTPIRSKNFFHATTINATAAKITKQLLTVNPFSPTFYLIVAKMSLPKHSVPY